MQSQAKTTLIATRKAAGQCIQCGVAAGGKVRCPQCADKAKTSRQAASQRKKAAGICPNSGCNNPAMPGKTVCKECSDKATQAGVKRYQRNKALGVCRYCGRASGGKARCGDCDARYGTKATASYKKQWYDDRKAAGLCLNCDKPPRPGRVMCQECGDRHAAIGRERWLQMKADAFAAYGGPQCATCPENDIEILELDHIDGGGNQHRKEIGQGNLYNWLKQNNYPAGYRVLCPTCNKKAHRKRLAANKTVT